MTEKSGQKADKKPERDAKGRFIKGNSSGCGNGRPKQDPEAKEILKAATPAAARALVDLLQSKRENIRFIAAQEILNRTQGKPEAMSRIELTNKNEQGFILKWITEQTNDNTEQ